MSIELSLFIYNLSGGIIFVVRFHHCILLQKYLYIWINILVYKIILLWLLYLFFSQPVPIVGEHRKRESEGDRRGVRIKSVSLVSKMQSFTHHKNHNIIELPCVPLESTNPLFGKPPRNSLKKTMSRHFGDLVIKFESGFVQFFGHGSIAPATATITCIHFHLHCVWASVTLIL